jgi:hypothetical protein
MTNAIISISMLIVGFVLAGAANGFFPEAIELLARLVAKAKGKRTDKLATVLSWSVALLLTFAVSFALYIVPLYLIMYSFEVAGVVCWDAFGKDPAALFPGWIAMLLLLQSIDLKSKSIIPTFKAAFSIRHEFIDIGKPLPKFVVLPVGKDLIFVRTAGICGSHRLEKLEVSDQTVLSPVYFPQVVGYRVDGQPEGTDLVAGFQAMKAGEIEVLVQFGPSNPMYPPFDAERIKVRVD